MWLYRFAKVVLRGLYFAAWRIRVEGLENIPPEGPLIICGNHFHAIDPFTVGVVIPRTIHYMAKQEIYENKLLAWLANGVGAFPVKRGEPDRAALKRTLEILNEGGVLGIFPEGTRNKTGHLLRAEPGTAYFALKTGATVIPVGITTNYKLFSRIIVKFGPPVDLAPYKGTKLNSASLEEAGRKIMAAIGAQLVPPVVPEDADTAS